MSVHYTAFGEMAVSVGGARQPLTRRRERGVLSVLLAAHGSPVAAERLLAEVWGDDAPGQTLGSLQVAVSRLRTQLEPERAARKGSRLVSTAAGYSLVAEVDDVDVWRFEALAETALAATSPEARLTASEEALTLWTSTPYADCDSPLVLSERTRLEELQLTVEEHRARAHIDLGRPGDAQRSLATLAPQHPYRERLWSLLALAQYQCARQADALDTLRRLRTGLAEELGVDPSEEIQRLEQAVLRQDPSLTAPVPPTPAPLPKPPGTAPLPPAPTGTVGRQPVFDQAAALLEEASLTGSMRFLLVAGEPGIGKSRLVTDLGARASTAGFRVLVGRCHEGDYAPALWPWLGIVRSLAGQPTAQPKAQPDGQPKNQPGTAADPRLDPLLGGELTGEASGGGTGLRMFDAVVELVQRSADETPLLLVLEDLHWADATSLRLLDHLAGSGLRAPVVVTCTRRTTEATTGPALVDTMAALARAGAERIRLDGLDTGAVGELLQGSVGEHDARLDAVVADRTGGNPFFVVQYARLLAATPDLRTVAAEDLPVPDGIRDVLRQRLSRLPEEAATVLSAAAVLGRRIDPDLVAELSGVPVDRCLDLLDLALTSGLVEEQDAGYAFVHALARETMYGELSAARKMRLHDRAGRVIEGQVVNDADAAAAIAHHAHLAAPLGPAYAERACIWLGRAAAVATARHAHPEALELWNQVLADAPAESATSVESLCGAAGSLLRMARTEEARQSIDRAVRLARQLGRWDLVARGAAILNGAGVWSWREHGSRDDAFIGVLTEALEHVTGAERARVLATLQMELCYGWDIVAADRAGAESVEVARACEDPALLLEVLLIRIIASWGPGRAAMRLELIEEVLAHHPEGELSVFIRFELGVTLYEMCRPAEADAELKRCAEEAAALRHTGLEIPLAWWRFARARDLDDPRAAELGRAALELHRTSGYISGDELECVAAIRLEHPGHPVDPSTVQSARSAAPGLRAMVAHAVLEAGDPATAYDLLGEAAPEGASDYSVLAGHCLRVLVLARTGRPDEVTEALTRIEPYAGQACNYGSIDHLGAVDHFLACGYAALGDPRAVEHAERAVVLSEQLQCAPWRRRSEGLLEELRG